MAAISIPDDSNTDVDEFKMKSTPKFTVESSLKNHIMEILDALPAAPADRLASIFLSTLGNRQLRVGTLCSGSDSVVDVLQAPENAISTFAPRCCVFWLLSNIIEATVQKCQTSLWELFVMDGLILHRQPYHYVGFARIEIFFGCGRPGMALGGKYTCQTFYNPHWPVYRSPFMAVAGDGRSWEGMGFHSPWPGRISIDRLSPIFLRAEQADAEIDPRFAQSRNARAEHQ